MKTVFSIITKAALTTVTVAVTFLLILAGIGYLANHNRVQAQIDKPRLPISISFRNAFFGPGGVAIFKNESGQLLEVRATFTSPTENYDVTNMVIPAWGSKEIGPLNGWAFIGGQHIELTNNDFRPMEIAVR